MTGHDPDQDDVLKQLDAALQVAPSHAFADGVRARVSRSRTNTTRVWWGLAAAASIGLVTMTVWRPQVHAPAPAMVRVAPTQAPAPAIATTSPQATVAVERSTPVVMPRPEAALARAAVPAVASEPRLVVITNQGAVLRALWADEARQPAQIATEPDQVVESPATKPIEIDPIAPVPPIVISEIGKPAGSGGATPVIRRATATKETR